jgi:hypothetical protein
LVTYLLERVLEIWWFFKRNNFKIWQIRAHFFHRNLCMYHIFLAGWKTNCNQNSPKIWKMVQNMFNIPVKINANIMAWMNEWWTSCILHLSFVINSLYAQMGLTIKVVFLLLLTAHLVIVHVLRLVLLSS